MLDIDFIRKNPEVIKKRIAGKNFNLRLVDDFFVLDEKWRKIVSETDNLRAEQKKLSAEWKIEEAKKLKDKIQKLENELKIVETKRQNILESLPNLPLKETPVGKNEKDNVVLREAGEKPKFDFKPKDYLEIAEKLDLIDVERAAKVSGSRFGYLKNQAALLEFALIKFAFDKIISNKFVPIVPPAMIKTKMMRGMGYDGEEIYFLKDDDLVLVGTSEQAIGPMHGGEIFKEKDLPKRYLAFSSCFRREAGSYGKDTRGILRVHQFDKVEMFSFSHPEKSKEEHQLFLSMEEELMRELGIPYQVVQLCSGDLSRPSAATYDIEAWLPGQNNGKGGYRETHSSSNCTDFQARRLNIRYRDKEGKLNFVHTLNGTAFAIGRMIIAIIENYQQKDGSIVIPRALQKYL